MEYLQAFVLGLVQGVTEFLPISSTAHLKVVPVVLGWGDPGVAFSAVIQLGSIAAVLWYFWHDLSQITMGSIRAIRQRQFNSLSFRWPMIFVLGMVPFVIVGLERKKFIQKYEN